MRSLRPVLWALVTLGFLPPWWRAAGFLAAGMLVGLGAFVFHVSRAASYLSDDPETCVNCHVMGPHYLTWQHSSHARQAHCNDCHVPHDRWWHHYWFKARDGLWHATVFTLRREPQVILLSPGAVEVVESNCRRCHGEVVAEVSLRQHAPGDSRCWDCHREVPHGGARSLSATLGVFQPELPPVVFPQQKPTITGRPPRANDNEGL